MHDEELSASVHALTDAAITTIEEIIEQGECHIKFVHAFGAVWKVTIEKVPAQEIILIACVILAH